MVHIKAIAKDGIFIFLQNLFFGFALVVLISMVAIHTHDPCAGPGDPVSGSTVICK